MPPTKTLQSCTAVHLCMMAVVMAHLAVHICGVTDGARDITWWFESRIDGPAKMAQARDFINSNRNIAQGAYVFVPGDITAAGNWTWPDQNQTNSLLSPVVSTGVEIGIAINIGESVMQTGNAPNAVTAMANWITGISGVSTFMIDYEPQDNFTDAHRQKYADFLKALTSAMHAVNKQTAMCVGGNDFLDHNQDFSQWAATGVDRVMTMDITYRDYYGRDSPGKGESAVRQLLQQTSHAQACVGIGSMVTPPTAATWDYKWTKDDINTFVAFLLKKNVQHVSVFRADIENTNGRPVAWFVEAMVAFVSGKV